MVKVHILAHCGADLGDQRGHHTVAEVEIAAEVAVGDDIGTPEGLGHIGRKVDVAVEIVRDIARNLRLEPAGIDAPGLGCGDSSGKRPRRCSE